MMIMVMMILMWRASHPLLCKEQRGLKFYNALTKGELKHLEGHRNKFADGSLVQLNQNPLYVILNTLMHGTESNGQL